MAYIYGLYDMKDYEQCLFVGTINEIAQYLNYSPSTLRSHLTKKKKTEWKLLGHRYELVQMNESEDIYKYELFKQVIDAFKPKEVIFSVFDRKADELKDLLNKQIYNEQWKEIKGTNYSISNYGRVKSTKTNKLKSPRFKLYSYQVDIYKNGKRHTCQVARLVANYFIRELKENERVRHTDGDARNNYYKNLRIVSR